MTRRRSYGTGQVYEKHGAYYGRWRTADGRKLNRRIGPVRTPGSRDGLGRSEAERQFRRIQQEEETRAPAPPGGTATVTEAADSHRRKLALEGARKSYLLGCRSMQRVHIDPRLGTERLSAVRASDIERMASAMLASGLKAKTVHNVLVFLHGVFEHAIDRRWTNENPVRRAAKPKRRRARDANPDLQFLTMAELDAVLRAIPDDVVQRIPAESRRGRAGPAPPPPADVLGPVLRVVVLTAAMTGLRRSELLGLRWRDVDCSACEFATPTSSANIPAPASPTYRRAVRCRWRTESQGSSIAGPSGRSLAAMTIWSLPTRTRVALSMARR
jgi:hypothetical protein